MRRRALLFLAVVCVPAVALANVITVGNHLLVPNVPNNMVDIVMTGTDLYNYAEMRMLINGGVGPAPRVTQVFGSTAGLIPTANLSLSIWAGGLAGIDTSPNGTTFTSSGLSTAAAFETAANALVNTQGLFVTLTIDTTGVPPGIYSVSLTDNPSGVSGVYQVLSPPDPIPLEIINGSITVTPEPASVVMGLFALAGLAAVAVRRHRAHRVMFVRGRAIGAV